MINSGPSASGCTPFNCMRSRRLTGYAFFAWFRVAMQICVALVLLQAPYAEADDDFLEAERAFKFSARLVDGKAVAVVYEIADGYYMYREQFKFNATGARLGTPVLPAGKVKFDDTFQKEVETYRNRLTIMLP